MNPADFDAEQDSRVKLGDHPVTTGARTHKYFACSRRVLEQTGPRSQLDPAARVAAASIDRGGECGGDAIGRGCKIGEISSNSPL